MRTLPYNWLEVCDSTQAGFRPDHGLKPMVHNSESPVHDLESPLHGSKLLLFYSKNLNIKKRFTLI